MGNRTKGTGRMRGEYKEVRIKIKGSRKGAPY